MLISNLSIWHQAAQSQALLNPTNPVNLTMAASLLSKTKKNPNLSSKNHFSNEASLPLHQNCWLTSIYRAWRERRDADLTRRSEISASKKSETIKAAQSAIDDFYENYNAKKEKSIAQTRKDAEQFLANREDTSAGGTSWERIAKLVDLSGKGARGGASGTGKERFRELLTSLRKDEHAPGASGV